MKSLERTESAREVQDSLLVMKHYHTASLRHLKPARLSPLEKPLNPDYAHIPISWEKGGLLFYSEVFLSSLKGKKTVDTKHKPPKTGRRPFPRGAGFFHELLEIPVPAVTSGLQDLKLKSELGVAPGNLLSEAKLSLAIGCRYESGCKSLSALKYYKKLFFAAQLSANHDFEAIALNRMAIVYYNRGNFSKAKSMLRSHLDLTPDEFIPHYDMGVVARCLKQASLSNDHFLKALDLAESTQDSEGQCIAMAQLGLTSKTLNDLPAAQEYFQRAATLAKALGATDIEQLVTIALSFVLIFKGEAGLAEALLHTVMTSCTGSRAEQCSCNIGILRGNEALTAFSARFHGQTD